MRRTIVMLVGLVGSGCALPSETGENVEPSKPIVNDVSPAELTSELVGEAAQSVTRADCIESWNHNKQICSAAPPNLQPECYAACAAMLAGCLVVAGG